MLAEQAVIDRSITNYTFCPYAGNIFALKTLDSNKKKWRIFTKFGTFVDHAAIFRDFFSG
jgi:hypothetical protein